MTGVLRVILEPLSYLNKKLGFPFEKGIKSQKVKNAVPCLQSLIWTPDVRSMGYWEPEDLRSCLRKMWVYYNLRSLRNQLRTLSGLKRCFQQSLHAQESSRYSGYAQPEEKVSNSALLTSFVTEMVK